MLTKEDIKKASNLRHEDVTAWGGVVRLRVMTAKELTSYLSSIETPEGRNPSPEESIKMIVELLARTLCNENGGLLFENPEEAQILAEKDMKTLMDLFRVAQKLNGIGEEQELEKNSEASQ